MEIDGKKENKQPIRIPAKKKRLSNRPTHHSRHDIHSDLKYFRPHNPRNKKKIYENIFTHEDITIVVHDKWQYAEFYEGAHVEWNNSLNFFLNFVEI